MIIGTGFATGGMFLLNQLLGTPPEKIVIALLLIAFTTGMPGALGYLTIYMLERNKLFTMHVVILLPWVSVSIALIILAISKFNIIFNLTVEVPLILVFSSIGGVLAHQKHISKASA